MTFDDNRPTTFDGIGLDIARAIEFHRKALKAMERGDRLIALSFGRQVDTMLSRCVYGLETVERRMKKSNKQAHRDGAREALSHSDVGMFAGVGA